MRLERWGPLIERPAYHFRARAVGELDSWHASALVEAQEDIRDRETVLEKYYALTHTVAHLTLLCSGPSAEDRPKTKWSFDHRSPIQKAENFATYIEPVADKLGTAMGGSRRGRRRLRPERLAGRADRQGGRGRTSTSRLAFREPSSISPA